MSAVDLLTIAIHESRRNEPRTGMRQVIHRKVGLISVISVLFLIALCGALFSIAMTRDSAPLLSRSRPTPGSELTWQEIEQRALGYVRSNTPGTVTRITIHETTLGKLTGTPSCSQVETFLRGILVGFRLDVYNWTLAI